jgi:uncharacterized protein YbbK (DUF523 family)
MRELPKPIVVVSKFIEFESVRWNSQIISSDFVRKLRHCVTFISVCPEVEIGLHVPRDPLRVVSSDRRLKLVQPNTQLDVTNRMLKFADSFLDSLPEVDGFILKSSSPSCALKDAKIYPDRQEPASTARGPGFFGKRVSKKYPHLAIEDERRLASPQIAEHFLRKIFASTRSRHVRACKLQKRRIKLKPTKPSQHYSGPRGRPEGKLW